MQNHPSARELVNAALGKKLSPKGQAVLDAMDGKPTSDEIKSENPNTRKSKLLQLIDEKLASARSKSTRTKPIPSTRAESNRANSKRSTGPKSDSGKQRAAQNSLKHGYFANTAAPQPQDSTIFQALHHDLRLGLQPDGPVEEHLIRELAMFSARLQRLEAAEYALITPNIESNPLDPIMGDPVPSLDGHQIAAAFQQNAAALDQLHRVEVHLRRAYNRTWDRLAAIQKERHKLPLDESLKQSQRWLTYFKEKANIDQQAHARPSEPPQTPSVAQATQAPQTEATSRAQDASDKVGLPSPYRNSLEVDAVAGDNL